MMNPQSTIQDFSNSSTSWNMSFNQSTQSLTNNQKLKKLPFYEVVDEIIKPQIFNFKERTNLDVSQSMTEVKFVLSFSPEHINMITMNRDLSNGSNNYLYQVQIRICLLEDGSTEIVDYIPSSLRITVSNKLCELPPIISTFSEFRRTPMPIDISGLLILNSIIKNTIQISWIPYSRKYVIAVYLVKKIDSNTLLQNLKDTSLRSVEETKYWIINKLTNVDPTSATTNFYFSLICPLGKTRMKTPAKSIHCDHLQCFDVTIFLLMNENNSTWKCPVCNKPCLYDDIKIESYFLEIVSNSILPDECEKIEILPDGTWRVYEEYKE